MLYPTAIHAFVDIGTSEYPGEGAEPVLSAKDLSEAHQLVASVNQPKGWVTRYTSNVLDLSHEEGGHIDHLHMNAVSSCLQPHSIWTACRSFRTQNLRMP